MMKKTIVLGITAITAVCLAVNTASAQNQWTPEQKAVWKTEKTMAGLWVKGDIEGVLSYFDDDFENWPPNSPTPVPKSVMGEWMKYAISQGRKIDHFGLIPRVIWVKDNYAYTEYYSTIVMENKKGKKQTESGFNLDVFMKKGNKWMMVASMTMDAPRGNK